MTEATEKRIESLLNDYTDRKKYGEITIKFEAGKVVYIKAAETFKNENKNKHLTKED